MPLYVPRNKLSLRSAQTSGIQTVNPSASANTKGAYVQLIASLTNNCRMLRVEIFGNPSGTTTKSWLVDVAIGAAASEVVVIQNIGVQATVQYAVGRARFMIPLRVPAGTRISARCQCNTGTSPEYVLMQVTAYDGDVKQLVGGGGVDSLGEDLTASKGTAITPGSSSVMSAYVTIKAATVSSYVGIIGVIDMGPPTAGAYNNLLTDIAIGAAAAEQVVIPGWWSQSWDSYIREPCIEFHPMRIPAGTRLSARMSEGGAATAKGLILYGVKR